jgi:hypothetical protein
MKPPCKIKGAYPQNYIVDADGADVVTSITLALDCEIDAMQLLCDALNANSDPTLREVEIPAEMFPLPELPKGKTRWIGRGAFDGQNLGIFPNRKIRFWSIFCDEWQTTQFFAGTQFHIEAVLK